MPEGNFTGNLSEDQTKCLGRGTDGVTDSAAMLLLGVFFESTGIVHSYGVLLLGTRHKAQGAGRKAQGKSLNSLKPLKPFKSQAKLAPTGDFGAEIVFCTLLAARLS